MKTYLHSLSLLGAFFFGITLHAAGLPAPNQQPTSSSTDIWLELCGESGSSQDDSTMEFIWRCGSSFYLKDAPLDLTAFSIDSFRLQNMEDQTLFVARGINESISEDSRSFAPKNSLSCDIENFSQATRGRFEAFDSLNRRWCSAWILVTPLRDCPCGIVITNGIEKVSSPRNVALSNSSHAASAIKPSSCGITDTQGHSAIGFWMGLLFCLGLIVLRRVQNKIQSSS